MLPRAETVRGFLAQLAQISQADAVVLQRWLLPWWKLRLIRRAAKVLIYELDDALFLRINTSKKPAYSTRRRRLLSPDGAAGRRLFGGQLFFAAGSRRSTEAMRRACTWFPPASTMVAIRWRSIDARGATCKWSGSAAAARCAR